MKRHSLQEKFLLYKIRRNKDADSYGKLYDIYVDRIFRFIYLKVSSPEVAEDLTSEVFLKTWEYINKTEKAIENFNALLYQVARNCVIDHYRKRNNELTTTDEEILLQIQDKRNIENETNVKVQIASLEKHLGKLKDIYKEVIILRFIEEFSVNEIAEIIGKSKANVRVLLHRGIKVLKEIADENK